MNELQQKIVNFCDKYNFDINAKNESFETFEIDKMRDFKPISNEVSKAIQKPFNCGCRIKIQFALNEAKKYVLTGENAVKNITQPEIVKSINIEIIQPKKKSRKEK